MSGNSFLGKLNKKGKRKNGSFLPAGLEKQVYVDKIGKDDPVYHLKLRGVETEKAIFYVYDSNLNSHISEKEVKFLVEIMQLTKAELFLPAYPLTPEYSCKNTYDMLIHAYKNAMAGFEKKDAILWGTGAGGGLALGIALQAWKQGFHAPGQLVLVSPVLDFEFFDQRFKKQGIMTPAEHRHRRHYQEWVQYLDTNWIRNYVGKTEYTAPIHESLADLNTEMIIVSGTKDPFNTYARDLCHKVSDTGRTPKFLEYMDMKSDFYLHNHFEETGHMKRMIHDLVTGRSSKIVNRYLFDVKTHAEWAKYFPEIFRDQRATKYLVQHKDIDFSKYKKPTPYTNLMQVATQGKLDESVKTFIKQYPNGTVVYLGCGLDTMFERVDNGRILWYNMDSPARIVARSIYTGRSSREHLISKSVLDDTWMDDVKCNMENGLLLVFRDLLTLMKPKEVSKLMDTLYERFRGCNVLFNVPTRREMLHDNIHRYNKRINYRKRKFYMNDVLLGVEQWDPTFRVIKADSVLSGVDLQTRWSTLLKWMYHLSKKTEGWKMVLIRLGPEQYVHKAN